MMCVLLLVLLRLLLVLLRLLLLLLLLLVVALLLILFLFQFFHAGSVLGEALPVRPLEMQLLRGEMLVDGGSVGSGFGSDIINGHPLEALAWLAGSPVAERMGT